MSYPPEFSRSCHEADGRSDKSGGSIASSALGTSCLSSGLSEKQFSNSDDSRPLPYSENDSEYYPYYNNWYKWTQSLDSLLEDSDGVATFKAFLSQENCGNLLDFWFACHGFKSKVDPSDNRKILQLIKAIYRTYIRGGNSSSSIESASRFGHQSIRLRPETRRAISDRISRKQSLDQTVFDAAHSEVDYFLRTTAYPAFIASQNRGLHSYSGARHQINVSAPKLSHHTQISSQNSYPNPIEISPQCSTYLPPLDEDKELKMDSLIIQSLPSSILPNRNIINKAGVDSSCVVANPYPQNDCILEPTRQITHVLPRNANCAYASQISPAPLTVENVKMTRLYRAELSYQCVLPATHNSPEAFIDAHPQKETVACDNKKNLKLHPDNTNTKTHCRVCNLGVYGHSSFKQLCASSAYDPIPSSLTNPNNHQNPTKVKNSYHTPYLLASEKRSISSGAQSEGAPSLTDSGNDELESAHQHHFFPDTFGVWSSHKLPHSLLPPPTCLSRSPEVNIFSPSSAGWASATAETSMLPIPIGESLPGSHSGPLVSLPFHLHPPHRYNQSGDLASLPRPPGKDHDLPSNMIQLSVSSRLPFSNVPPLVSSQSQIAHFSLSDSPQSQNHHVSHHQQSKQSLPLQQKQISLPHDQISHQFRCFGSADEPSCSFVGTNASINLCSTGNTLSLNKTSQNLASVQPQPQALHLSLGQPPAASKERNLAEHDPAAFVRLLTERLQRLTCSDPNVIPSFSPNKHELISVPFGPSIEGHSDPVALARRLDVKSTNRVPAEGHRDLVGSNALSAPVLPLTSASGPLTTTGHSTVAEVFTSNISSTLPAQIGSNQPQTAVVTEIRTNEKNTSVNCRTALLQRPWAGRLLAAARVFQQREKEDDAQAILEDHCSRIWAASADRTPTSSGGGSGNDGIQTVSVSCAGTLSGNGYSFGPTGAGGPIVKVPSTSGPCLLPRCSSCQPANTIAANPLPTWLISAPLSLPPQIHSLAPLPSSTTNDVFNPPRSASSSQQHVFLLQQDSRPPVPSYTSFIPGASQKQTGFHVTPNTECPDCATSPLRLATARGYRYSQRRQQPRARLRRRSPAVANTNANHASIATTCTLGCRPSSGNVAFTLASQIEAAWPHRDILLPHPNEMSRSAPTEHGPSVNTCQHNMGQTGLQPCSLMSPTHILSSQAMAFNTNDLSHQSSRCDHHNHHNNYYSHTPNLLQSGHHQQHHPHHHNIHHAHYHSHQHQAHRCRASRSSRSASGAGCRRRQSAEGLSCADGKDDFSTTPNHGETRTELLAAKMVDGSMYAAQASGTVSPGRPSLEANGMQNFSLIESCAKAASQNTSPLTRNVHICSGDELILRTSTTKTTPFAVQTSSPVFSADKSLSTTFAVIGLDYTCINSNAKSSVISLPAIPPNQFSSLDSAALSTLDVAETNSTKYGIFSQESCKSLADVNESSSYLQSTTCANSNLTPTDNSESTSCQITSASKNIVRSSHVSVTSSVYASSNEIGNAITSTTSSSLKISSETSATVSSYLVVGYYLCDDPVPYRCQWPGSIITLAQFKQLVPKKGPFRYFFKKLSNEFDSGVVHQEISDDSTILPLWEGKIVARVERTD